MSAPLPPKDLNARKPIHYTINAGVEISRFYQKKFGPLYFDRTQSGRLNAPDGSFGVFYAAANRKGSFAETFLRRVGETLIATDFIAARAHASFRVLQPLRLAKLFGNGLARIGATAEVTHRSAPYAAPQEWSLQLHAHPDQFDGIAYQSRHNDTEVCYALFDRAGVNIEIANLEPDLDQDWFYELAEHHGVGVV